MLVYVAHPLGDDIDRNVERTKRWLAFLVTREPDASFVVPWLPYVDAYRVLGHGGQSDAGNPLRDRFMRDNLRIAATCGISLLGGIVLCGPRISTGMKQELHATLDAGGWVSDLTTAIDPLEASLYVAFAAMTAPLLNHGRMRFTRRHAEDASVYG